MPKYEKEIKILNIDITKAETKLKEMKANFKGEKFQQIYTYDIPTIYYRFLEIRNLLNTNNNLLYSTNIIKLKTLLSEVEDLTKENVLEPIYKKYNITSLTQILNTHSILEILNDQIVENIFQDKLINPNKWLRLRQSNDKIELTTKHVLDKPKDKIQSVIETEIEVSSLEEANKLIESLGLARRNYQEKIRKSYTYKDAEIEIDIWPKLEPYIEIECDNNKTIDEIINILDIKENKIVSCNTNRLYKEKGIDLKTIPELKFDNEKAS